VNRAVRRSRCGRLGDNRLNGDGRGCRGNLGRGRRFERGKLPLAFALLLLPKILGLPRHQFGVATGFLLAQRDLLRTDTVDHGTRLHDRRVDRCRRHGGRGNALFGLDDRRRDFGHRLRFDDSFGLRNHDGFGFRNRLGFDDDRDRLDDHGFLDRHEWQLRLGNDLTLTGSARIALHEHALLANLDLDGARPSRGIGLLDLGRLATGQRDLLARLRTAVHPVEIVEQLRLVMLAQGLLQRGLVHAGGLELLQQPTGLDLELGGELRDGHLSH
jgi:hypothetical protein